MGTKLHLCSCHTYPPLSTWVLSYKVLSLLHTHPSVPTKLQESCSFMPNRRLPLSCDISLICLMIISQCAPPFLPLHFGNPSLSEILLSQIGSKLEIFKIRSCCTSFEVKFNADSESNSKNGSKMSQRRSGYGY